MTTEDKSKKRVISFPVKKQRIIAVVVGAALAVTGLIWLVQQLYQTSLQRIDASKYQIVILTTGQMYFGKLQNQSGDYLVIKSPYVEQAVESEEKNADGSAKQAQTTLLKVSSQLYGPDDSIAIKASQVILWQNLRDDSKVSQAIKSKE